MVVLKPFTISTGLKDLIGRDLITDDFVAVFELVKNSFDAHAQLVQLRFEDDRIVVADNGKGMSYDDIINKWLFVAYSAKKDGTEDKDYREKIADSRRVFAGSKGVGRFSCDRLGSELNLCSKAAGHPIQKLEIDWSLFEGDQRNEFGEVELELSEIPAFPKHISNAHLETGTVLEISKLRSEWDRKKLLSLKRELTKLINPFESSPSDFKIELVATDQTKEDAIDLKYNAELTDGKEPRIVVNGIVDNPILEVLSKRTTVIKVEVVDDGDSIETVLEDRGELIYRIREKNPYKGLKDSEFYAEIYYLNRKAKAVFARRMGLPSIQFGSVFLFRNGFRVMPVGAEDDDYFRLNRRKQQGVRRFLGGRDLIGRVQVNGTEGFEEATSRDQGLIRSQEVEDLIHCVTHKCVRRLERYVVDITWKDRYDKDTLDSSRMKLDQSSALITQLVSRLAATKDLTLVEFNPEIVRIVDSQSEQFESSLKALELLAEETGNKSLLEEVNSTRIRLQNLQKSEEEARRAEHQATTRAEAAEKTAVATEVKYREEKERSQFLIAATSLDKDTIVNLHHQIIMHASDVHLGIRRMMGKLRKDLLVAKKEWIDFLERISFRNSQILTASRFATKSGYKQQSGKLNSDLVIYILDYIKTVSSLWAPQGIKVNVQSDGKQLQRSFRPIEIGIVIDNLVSNAAKARASTIFFFLGVSNRQSPELRISVADDGVGWSHSFGQIERVFEKGVTTTDGSGLGLYHVRQVIEGLGGLVEVHEKPYSDELEGAHLTIKIPS